MQPRSIRIIFPCGNLADVNRIDPLYSKLKSKGYECKRILGCYIETNRNQGVSGQCQKIEQAHPKGLRVFIDSDIVCTVADVEAEIKRAETYPIIGVPYKTQKDDGFDCCRNKIGSKAGMVEVEEIGFGLIAIQNSVFNKMKFPYFQRPVETKEDCADLVGEDVYFCRVARELGYKICADYDIKIGHDIRKDQLTKGAAMKYKYKTNLLRANNIAKAINGMTTGGPSGKELRSQAVKIIADAFDGEVIAKGQKPPYPEKEFELESRVVRSITNGLYDLMASDDCTNELYELYKLVAQTLRVFKNLLHKMNLENEPEFDGELDDEPVLVEPEPEVVEPE